MSSDKVSLFKIDLSIGDRIRPVHGWRMTALIYFGEMLVASLLAILLLAISPFGLSSDATLFAAGIVAWTFAEYVVHRFVLHGLLPTQHRLHHASPDVAVLIIFWQIWACFALTYLIAGGAFPCGRLICLFMVPIRASLRPSRSRYVAAAIAYCSRERQHFSGARGWTCTVL